MQQKTYQLFSNILVHRILFIFRILCVEGADMSDHSDNHNPMLSLKVALPVFTVFWLLFGAVLPCFVPKGPNKG